MKLSISNIIWEKGKDKFESFIKEIKENDIHNIELSLNSIFEEPTKMSKQNLRWLKNLFQSYDISISALHSLTYTRPDLELFNDPSKREELIEYMKFYFDIAQELNTKNLVYGSAKTRDLYNYSKTEADNIFIDFLYRIDEMSPGINFNIEPLSQTYCNYLNTYHDGVEILENKKFKNIFIQLDIRSVIENDENIESIFNKHQYIKHVHIGEPNMTMPTNHHVATHQSINKKLLAMDYENFLSIEVLKDTSKSLSDHTNETIRKTRSFYNAKS